MKREKRTWHSPALDKDMTVIVCGEGGVPMLGFPTQDSMASNWEDFGMTECLGDEINGGKLQLFVPDTVDAESWSCGNGIGSWRTARQESYFRYITEELIPFIRDRNGTVALPIVCGCSMGADHAVISFFRRPDLFSALIALSGVYDASYFYGGYMDADLYNNSPEVFLRGMPADHPYIGLYNTKRMILCTGQGACQEDGVRTLRDMERIFREKGIHAWCDYWGPDVNHDWPWWFRQMKYFLPYVLCEKT